MIKRQIKLEHSPFHKQRDMTAPRGSQPVQAQLSPELYREFINFATTYNTQHHVPKTKQGTVNKSTPLKHIIKEYFDNNAFKYQCLEHLHIIMAFNWIDFQTPFDTDVECAVIGYVEHPHGKFTKHKPFTYVPDKFNKSRCIYAVEDFNEDTFDLLNLKTFDREVLFNIDPSLHDDFEAVREHLQELYENIDFEDAQICMFNPNNYLDIINDGVFVSRQEKYEHEGFVVIADPDDIYKHDRIIARITWSYIAGLFNFKFDVVNMGFFHDEIINNAYAQAQVDYMGISSGFIDRKAGLKVSLKNTQNNIDYYKEMLEKERERAETLQALINELDKD